MDAIKAFSQIGGAGSVGGTSSTSSTSSAGATDGSSFKDVLLKNLSDVNQMQQDADTQLENYVTGRTNNMSDVISASQKASMAFSMLTQVRNKLQDAYDELKNLKI